MITVSEDLDDKLHKISSASVYSALWDLGYRNLCMHDILPVTLNNIHIVGKALTVRYLPFTKYFNIEEYRKSSVFKAAQIAGSENVVVMDALGSKVGVIGDCIAMGFKTKGVAGVVIDGGVRDVPLIKKMLLPVFARCVTPAHIEGYITPIELNTTINCDGVQVCPDDIIVGDDDGVVVIPRSVMKEAIEIGWRHERLDEESRKRISSGIPLDGAYPPKKEWLEE